MKKLLFACVCAATVAAFAVVDPLNSIGFEGFTAGMGNIGSRTDTGADSVASGYYFAYEPANGSTDGSTVKVYGVDENLPLFNYNGQFGVPAAFADETLAQEKYLELSTEGGTLWRSATETTSDGQQRILGEGLYLPDMGDDGVLYVDTMVQFTPTEDGEIPTVDAEQDRIAIWLNVDATNEENPVTNLCVYANVMDRQGTSTPEKFTISNAKVVPGVWYRLTVKAIADISNGDEYPCFMIYLDGVLLKSDKQALTEDFVTRLLERNKITEALATDIRNGSVFGSLLGSEGEPYFRGVGFKGSGAIDDFQIDTATPNFIGAVTTLDFTLKWGEGISAVSYTIGEDTVAATSGKTIDVAPNTEVTVQVTYAPWYVAGDDTAGTSFTVSQAGQTYNYTAQLAATPEAAGATGLDGVTTAAAKTWADAKSLTPAQIAECAYALDAYLLNTGLDAAPALAITSIEEVADGWQITVKATAGDATVSLDGINGKLKVKTAATLGALAEAEAAAYTATFDADGVATIKVTGDNKNFMKATVVAQ